MSRHATPPLAGECTSAIRCGHEATDPPLWYWDARKVFAGESVKSQYADLPETHQRAIWRARQDFPDKRRQLREMRWARAWLRRRP